MCKHAYDKLSERTGKVMIFCKLKGNTGDLSEICVSQKFCGKRDRYIELNPKRDCKYFEDSIRVIENRE